MIMFYNNFLALQRILLWPIFQILYILFFVIYFQIVPSIFQLFLGVLFILIIEGVGTSICLHRYFSHTAFKTSRIFQFVLGFIGSITNHGPLLWWSSIHNRHHAHCDSPEDPHSVTQTNFFYAYVGFMLYEGDYKLKCLPRKYRKIELLFLNQVPFAPLFIFSFLLINMTSVATFVYVYWIPSVITLLFTLRSNLINHPKSNKKKCKAVDNPGIIPKVGFILGEGFHADHHNYAGRAKRPGLDLPYLLVLKPLNYFGIIWDLKQMYSANKLQTET